MPVIVLRLTVPANTSHAAPLVVPIDAGDEILKAVTFITPTTLTLDQMGARITNRGKRIYPAPGSYTDLTTGLAGCGDFAPVFIGSNPPAWIPVNAQLEGAPYDLDVALYNEDVTDDMLLIALLHVENREVKSHVTVIPMSEVIAALAAPAE